MLRLVWEERFVCRFFYFYVVSDQVSRGIQLTLRMLKVFSFVRNKFVSPILFKPSCVRYSGRDWGVDELSRYSMAVVNRQQATDDGGGVEEEIRKEIMLGSLLEGARLGKQASRHRGVCLGEMLAACGAAGGDFRVCFKK